MSRSFKSFVKKHLFNLICDSIENNLVNNFEDFDISSKRFDIIDNFEVYNYKLIRVDAMSKYDEDDIKVLATVEVEIGVEYHQGKVYDYDTLYQWFLVEGQGSIQKHFNDFQILKVSSYEPNYICNNLLSDQFTPYIKKDELDKYSEELLKKYYPEALSQKNIIPVYPKKLAERMGLTIEEHVISNDSSLFGAIIFEDTTIDVYDSGKTIKQEVKKGTIIVDPFVYFLRSFGSENNTIVHECVHWAFHRKGYELEKLFDPTLSKIICGVTGSEAERDISNLWWMEWQANALAPRVQMPLAPFKHKALEFFTNRNLGRFEEYSIDTVEDVIEDLADFFLVSKQAAKIRLIDAGYEQAKGALVYLNDSRVKPHYDRNYKLKNNETYAIEIRDLIIESIRNIKLKELLHTGQYKYISAHVCLDDPKYIQKNPFGEYELTLYARSNMAECCLRFEIKNRSSNMNIGTRLITECYLCRIINQDVKVDVIFNQLEGEQQIPLVKQQEEYFKQVAEILQRLPNDFAGAVSYLIDLSDETVEDLAWKIGISDRQLRRIKNDGLETSLRTIIALCIALELPIEISEELLKRSSFNLSNAKQEHLALKHVLLTSKTVDEANRVLINLNLQPLNKEK